MIPVGTMVPFQPGLFTVKAEVLKFNKETDQYVLMQSYMRWNTEGKWSELRRYYYRDRRLIDGLTEDARRIEQACGMLRD